MKFLSVFLVVFSSVAMGSQVDSGHGVGNGTGTYDFYSDSAWFLDASRTAKYCIATDPAFGVSSPEAIELVEKALQIWSEYITKVVNADSASNGPLATFVTAYSRSLTCYQNTDLVFHLGDEPANVKKARAVYPNAFGLAVRESYDKNKAWGRGFIWIGKKGEWKDPKDLLATLLHELGHVYGNGHAPGTIMRDDLDTLFGDLNKDQAELNFRDRIEHTHHLFNSINKPRVYQSVDSPALKEFYSQITGKPAGNITAILSHEYLAQNQSSLCFKNSTGPMAKLIFEEKHDLELNTFFTTIELFKLAFDQQGQPYSYSVPFFQSTKFGTLRPSNGKGWNAVMIENGGNYPISITLADSFKTVFQADTGKLLGQDKNICAP